MLVFSAMIVGMIPVLVLMGVRMLRPVLVRVFVGMTMVMIVFLMIVCMRMLRSIRVGVFVRVLLFMLVPLFMRVNGVMIRFVREMHVELHPFDLGFLLSSRMQMVALKLQLPEFVFEFMKIDSQIQQRPDKHVAADAAENIEIKCFHY